MYLNDIFLILDSLMNQNQAPVAHQAPATSHASQTPVSHPKVFNETYSAIPKISRVTFNGNTTIVWFTDNSRCIVNCSKSDNYDRKTAIAYALVKRLLGIVKPNGEVDGAGFGMYLQKIVDSGFDQKLEEEKAAEKKKAAHDAHLARQAAEQKAAFEKRVEERAKQILLERAATDRANQIEDAARTKQAECLKKQNECPSCEKNCSSNTTSKEYVKPDKPFKEFTEQEKREYWNYHNAKRRASKKSSK